jgi:hypothetical protein
LDALNENIVADLQEQGIAAPSTTRIHGHLAVRVNITNHRSRREDFDLLIRAVVAAGNERALLKTRNAKPTKSIRIKPQSRAGRRGSLFPKASKWGAGPGTLRRAAKRKTWKRAVSS